MIIARRFGLQRYKSHLQILGDGYGSPAPSSVRRYVREGDHID